MNIYEKIPEFDQETQMVVQKEPVKMGDDMYYGVEIVDVPQESEVPNAT